MSPDRNARAGHDGAAIVILAATLGCIVAVFVFFDPFPQPASYYAFADQRTMFGIPNFLNVITNLPFAVFGGLGLWRILSSNSVVILPQLRVACLVLFAGVTMTAFGSAWFHLAPNNDTLFWDRLPMTVAFMPLLAIVLGEHVSVRLARILLWPLLLVGTGSVLYWSYTESVQAGDLRLYGIVQFLPMLLIPTILVVYHSTFDTTRFLWQAMILYGAAKLFEHFDLWIFSMGGIISGHSIKHVVASIVPLVLIRGMMQRRPAI